MRRAVTYTVLALLALIVVAAAAVAWLLGTSAGARWAIETIPATPAFSLSVRQVEGRLLDHLALSGVHLVSGKEDIRLDRVKLDWQPLLLFSGALQVQELSVSGVRIKDDTPLPAKKKPIDLTWPHLPPFAELFEARIARLTVTDLSYRRLKEPPVTVTALSAALSWRYTLLLVSNLKALAPSGLLQGEIVAGLKRPSLRLDLIAAPAKPVADLEVISVQARLSNAKAPEQVAGGVTISGKRGKVRVLSLAGDIGITRNSVNLRRVRLERSGQRGVVDLDGTVDLSREEPALALRVKGTDLDLGPQLHHTTDITGTITLAGNLERYRGRFSLANSGRGWQRAAVAGAYQGGKNAARFAPFSANLLEGRVAGEVDLAWGALVKVRAALTGRGLNPAVVLPGWKGGVNFNAGGDFSWSAKEGSRWGVKGRLLNSTLRGKALSGEVDARSAGNDLALRRLFLHGEGVDLSASGVLSERIDLSVRATDLSLIAPDAGGSLEAQGWVRYRAGRVAGTLSGGGRDLFLSGMELDQGRFSARISDAAGYPLTLCATLTGLTFENVAAHEVSLSLSGTVGSHAGEVVVVAPGADLRLALAGGYRDARWRGEITDFSGRDKVGPFKLEAPAALSAGADGFTLAPFMVRGVGEEFLRLSGSMVRPARGEGAFAWGKINLARANGWMEEGGASGVSSGQMQFHLLPQGRVDLQGSVEAQGSFSTGTERFDLEHGSFTVDGDQRGVSAQLELRLLKGALQARFTSPVPPRLALPKEGVLAAQWSGLDVKELASWFPAGMELEGRVAGQLSGRLLPGDRLDLKGSSSLDGGIVRWRKEDQALYASLERSEVALTWQGGTHGAALRDARLSLAARVTGAGNYSKGESRLTVAHAVLSVDADEHGSRAMVEVVPEGKGTLKGTFSSDRPVAAALPETGDFELRLADLDPALVQSWLPGAVRLEGGLSAQVTGKLLPGQRLDMTGEALFSQGGAAWRGEAGEMKAQLKTAHLSFLWRGEELTGSALIALAGPGEARGSFRLPLPARIPVAFNQGGEVSASLAGKLEERGIISAFLPGVVQESHGDLDLDLSVGGVWRDPVVRGGINLTNGGGYLPPLGIHLTELALVLKLEKDAIRIDTLKAKSGPGQMEVTGVVELAGWKLKGYRGTISGERFQTFYLPELQVWSSPQLVFEGNQKKLVMRGEVRLPEMRVLGPPAHQALAASRDVVIEGAPPQREKALPLELDVRVRVTIGDKVQVKAEGIDAQLGGGIEIFFSSLEKINSSGEIKVVKGRYRAYGLDLDIVRGRIYYAGGPIDEPTLDILALRTVGEVKAGVTVGGILREPVVKLYSEPAMPDVDILAYMVLGHPLGSSSEQGSLVAQAAGVLFSSGQSSSVQEQIKSRLGLSTLEIQAASPETTGRMGYKEIPVTPTGAPSKAAPISQSMLTVGKYLTPKLYFSYGRSLFTGSNLFMLRYDIFRHWQIESQTGTESGMDVYYKIEFK